MVVKQCMSASRPLKNWHTDCEIKLVSLLEVYRLLVDGHFLHCHLVGTIIKQKLSISNTCLRLPGCIYHIKIVTLIIPINNSKGYVQDYYGRIFQELPNNKLKCEKHYILKISLWN